MLSSSGSLVSFLAHGLRTTLRPSSSSSTFASIIHAKSEAEKAIADKISSGISSAATISVQDVSGGCGSFYQIEVVASEFEGQSMIKQHRRICSVLEEEMKAWHGSKLITRAR